MNVDHPREPVVVITGASSGIGRATALAYADRGAHVVLAARGEALLHEAAAACEPLGAASVTVVPTDVCDPVAVERLLTDARSRLGRVDVVVHAAMIMAYGAIEELPLDVYSAVVNTGLHGTVHVARSTLPIFRGQGQGSLVIVSSLLASVPVPGIGAYVTAKWGQLGLAHVLQLETRDAPDIRVITVAPGGVDTPIYRRAANVEGRPGKPPPPVDSPEKVASAVLRAVDGRRSRVSVGPLNPLVLFGFRFTPPLYARLVGPLYRNLAHGRKRIAPTMGNVFSPSRPEDGAGPGGP
ncbi:SDR family oxidoreductase [soil metagenome]